jgi:hypothetical protein
MRHIKQKIHISSQTVLSLIVRILFWLFNRRQNRIEFL